MAKLEDITCRSPFWKNLHDRYAGKDPSNEFRRDPQSTPAQHSPSTFSGCGYHIRKNPHHDGAKRGYGVSSPTANVSRQDLQRAVNASGHPHRVLTQATPEASHNCGRGTPNFGSAPPPKKCPTCTSTSRDPCQGVCGSGRSYCSAR